MTACPYWPECGCSPQSGLHTCDAEYWRAVSHERLVEIWHWASDMTTQTHGAHRCWWQDLCGAIDELRQRRDFGDYSPS